MRRARSGGGVLTKTHFAFAAAIVLIGLVAVPTFSPTAAANSPGARPAWKQELFAIPSPLDPSEQGNQAPFGDGSGLHVGANVRVNAPQKPAPDGFLGRSETTIAVADDGLHMVAGWNDAQGFCGPPFGAACTPQTPSGLSGYGFSADGGATWTDGGAPDPALGFASVGFPVFTRGDPWLAADADGHTFLYANLAVRGDTGEDLGVSVHRGAFARGSFSWQDVRVFNSPNGANDFYDKEAIATDSQDAANAVVSLTNFQALCGIAQNGFGQIEVWRTRDGGNTWLGPAIAGPEQADSVANCGNAGTLQQSSVPVFGPNGEVFVTWQVGPTFSLDGVPSTNAAIFAARSLNGGKTFGAPVKVADINSMRQDSPVGYNRARINDHPRIAVLTGGDHDGRVLVAFPSANVPTSSPGTAQNLVSVNLFLSFSDDSGVTWSKPKPIAGSVPANGVKRFWPVVTVSPGDASVNVVYYESLEQAVPGAPACNIAIGGGLRRVGPAHSLVNTMLVRSKDGGRTFGDPVTVSSVTSDWCAGTTNIRPNFGDYIGATTVGTTTFAVWADSRETILIGGTPRNVVDVFFAPVGEGQ